MTRRIFRVISIVVMLAGIGVAGTYSVLSARHTARAEADQAVLLRARSVAGLVSAAVNDDLQAVASTGRSGTVTTAVLRSNGQRSLHFVSGYFAPAFPFVSELMATHRRIAAISFYDRSGRLVGRIPPDGSVIGRRFAQQDYFKNATMNAAPQISRLFAQLGVPKGPVEAYSFRLTAGHRTWGVIVGTTPLAAFDMLVAANMTPGDTVHVYNAAGELVSPSYEASGRSYLSDATIGPLLRGKAVVKRTGSRVVAAAPATAIGWTVTVSEPMSRAYKRAGHQTVHLSLLMGAITLAALGLSVLALLRARAPG